MSEQNDIKECQVGPLPNFVVHGTVSLVPNNPETVKIFSLSQAAKRVIKPAPINIDEVDEHFSYDKILAGNVGTAVWLTCVIQAENSNTTPNVIEGIIKTVYKDPNPSGNNSFVILKPLAKNEGENLIRCSTIAHLETIQRKSDFVDGS